MFNGYLKQSTASQTRTIGPFLDDTDFKTAETALTIANTDIKLMANGGNSASKNSGGGTHKQSGHYAITFDATDTATVGELTVSCVVSGALPVFAKFFVLEEAVYDMLFGASATGYIANQPVDVNTIKTQAVTCAAGVTVLASVGTAATSTAQTGDAYARLGAPAGASVSADIAAVKTQTAAIETDTGTDIPATLSTIAGYVDTEVAAIKAQTDKLTFDGSNRVASNPTAINSDSTAAANLAKATRSNVRATVDSGASTTSIPTSACSPAGAAADQFKGRIITFDADTTTTALRGQSTDITASSNAATPTFTVTALTTAPAAGDTFSIT